MANSSFETFKQGGQAIEETAKKTGEQAQGVYEQAKNTAADVYDKTTEYAGDAMTRAQDSASELDEMVSEGLVTTEPVHIVAYRASGPTSSGK